MCLVLGMCQCMCLGQVRYVPNMRLVPTAKCTSLTAPVCRYPKVG